jgi:hypothetical protein
MIATAQTDFPRQKHDGGIAMPLVIWSNRRAEPGATPSALAVPCKRSPRRTHCNISGRFCKINSRNHLDSTIRCAIQPEGPRPNGWRYSGGNPNMGHTSFMLTGSRTKDNPARQAPIALSKSGLSYTQAPEKGNGIRLTLARAGASLA